MGEYFESICIVFMIFRVKEEKEKLNFALSERSEIPDKLNHIIKKFS